MIGEYINTGVSLLGAAVILVKATRDYTRLSTRFDVQSVADAAADEQMREEFKSLREKVEHILDNGTFVRNATFDATIEAFNSRLSSIESSVENNFRRLHELRADSEAALTNRLNDQSTRILRLAEEVRARRDRPA